MRAVGFRARFVLPEQETDDNYTWTEEGKERKRKEKEKKKREKGRKKERSFHSLE